MNFVIGFIVGFFFMRFYRPVPGLQVKRFPKVLKGHKRFKPKDHDDYKAWLEEQKKLNPGNVPINELH